jgi:hypothetical protein
MRATIIPPKAGKDDNGGSKFLSRSKAGKAKSGKSAKAGKENRKSVKAGNEKRKSEKLDHRGH